MRTKKRIDESYGMEQIGMFQLGAKCKKCNKIKKHFIVLQTKEHICSKCFIDRFIQEGKEMTEIATLTEAVRKARDKLVEMNGIMGVILLQIESANLVNYEKNGNKPTWKVVCSFFTNMAGTEKVRREIFLDKATGEVVDYNGFQEGYSKAKAETTKNRLKKEFDKGDMLINYGKGFQDALDDCLKIIDEIKFNDGRHFKIVKVKELKQKISELKGKEVKK